VHNLIRRFQGVCCLITELLLRKFNGAIAYVPQRQSKQPTYQGLVPIMQISGCIGLQKCMYVSYLFAFPSSHFVAP
jgi:hypothetical protein